MPENHRGQEQYAGVEAHESTQNTRSGFTRHQSCPNSSLQTDRAPLPSPPATRSRTKTTFPDNATTYLGYPDAQAAPERVEQSRPRDCSCRRGEQN